MSEMEEKTITEPSTTEMEPANDDVIVIKSWIVAAVVAALVGAAAGFGGGYFVGQGAANAEVTAQLDAYREILAEGGALPEPTATPLPSRVEVDPGDGFAVGASQPEIVIVEFSDYKCGYCARFEAQTRAQILEEYGDRVQLVYRHFPVVGGQVAAQAAECAGLQGGYADFHTALFIDPSAHNTVNDYIALAEEQGLDVDDFAVCMESNETLQAVVDDYNAGVEYGVSGTPTFFINGVRLIGAQPFSSFQAVIDQELGE